MFLTIIVFVAVLTVACVCYAGFAIFRTRREENRRRKIQIEEHKLFLQALQAAEVGDFSQMRVANRYRLIYKLSDELQERYVTVDIRNNLSKAVEREKELFARISSLYKDEPTGSLSEVTRLIEMYMEFYLLEKEVFAILCKENDLSFSTIDALKATIVDDAERVHETLVAQAGNNRQSFNELEVLLREVNSQKRRYRGIEFAVSFPSEWNLWVVKHYDDPPLDSFDHRADDTTSWTFITQRLIDAVESRNLVECGIVLAHCHHYPKKRVMVGDVLYAEVARVFNELKAEAFGTIGEREAMNMDTE